MSYDLRIWIADPDAMARQAELEDDRSGRGWQIVLNNPDRVEEEDIPESIRNALPGIVAVVELNLEPISAPQSAHRRLRKLARHVAKAAHGVVENPQTGELETPRGIKRFTAEQTVPGLALVTMSWWFTEPTLDDPVRIDAFLDCLARHLPEALPKRYGLYEPPQHKLEETGRNHLRGFLLEHLQETCGVVWYPRSPVRYLHLGLSERWGPTKRGYRANYFKVEVDATVLGQSGWETQLKRFWRAVPDHLAPFYGDVRVLSGFTRQGRDYYDGEQHPICGPWFSGIPTQPPLAMVIAPEHTRIWAEAAEAGEQRGQFSFVEVADWQSKVDISSLTGPVPAGIAQQSPGYADDNLHPNWDRLYPENWPLGAIYDDNVW